MKISNKCTLSEKIKLSKKTSQLIISPSQVLHTITRWFIRMQVWMPQITSMFCTFLNRISTMYYLILPHCYFICTKDRRIFIVLLNWYVPTFIVFKWILSVTTNTARSFLTFKAILNLFSVSVLVFDQCVNTNVKCNPCFSIASTI